MSFSLSYLGYVSCWCSLVPFLTVPSACRVPRVGWLRGFGRCVCSFSQGYDACAKIRKNPITPAFFLVYLSSVCFLPAFSSVFPSFSFFSCGLLLALAEYFLNGYSQSITHTARTAGAFSPACPGGDVMPSGPFIRPAKRRRALSASRRRLCACVRRWSRQAQRLLCPSSPRASFS